MAKIYSIYFSATDNTKNMVNYFKDEIKRKLKDEKVSFKEINLLETLEIKESFESDDIVIIGMPVFAGRIPQHIVKSLNDLEGNRSRAIGLVTYGNRDYDDALLELTDILKDRKFNLIGAAATIGRHSIFGDVGKNRPNEDDFDKIDIFIDEIIQKIENDDSSDFSIPGNKEYKELVDIPLKPKGNRKCTSCGICVRVCPKDAIDVSRPRKTNKEKCISCGACIYHCPEKSRSFNGILYKIASRKFTKANMDEKSIELFK